MVAIQDVLVCDTMIIETKYYRKYWKILVFFYVRVGCFREQIFTQSYDVINAYTF